MSEEDVFKKITFRGRLSNISFKLSFKYLRWLLAIKANKNQGNYNPYLVKAIFS